MAVKSITSERKIESDAFKIKIGTLDKKNPNTIYVEAGTYIIPNKEKESYKSDIIGIEKEMKRLTKENLKNNNAIKQDFLLVTDVAMSRICPQRGTHFTLQFYFKPNQGERTKTFNELCSEYIKFHRQDANKYQAIIENYGFSCHKTNNAN